MEAIYARQSIDKKDSLSIESQIEQCKKFLTGDIKVFYDKGYSGKNTNRPEFNRLLKAVENGEIKKICVYRLDRFSRSIADFSRIWEMLDKHGVEFQSATENFDTSTPIGRAMLNIILVFAQLERETTSERVKDNYIHRFKLGAWAGGPAPYGFDLTKIIEDGVRASSLIANENAEIVKMLFKEYSERNISLRSLAKDLIQREVHGPKRREWDNVTISRILRSPVYVRADEDIYWFYVARGLKIQNPIEDFDGLHACNVIGRRDRSKNKHNSLDGQMVAVSNHCGFIGSQLWIKVQEKLENNLQIPRLNAGKYSWLTGLMKCGKCGYAIKINYIKKENRCNLVCSGHSNFAICEGDVNVRLEELESHIGKEIDKMLCSSPPKGVVTPSRNLASKLLEIEQRIERLVCAISRSGDVAVSYISAQIEALHKEREELLKSSYKDIRDVKQIDFFTLSFDEKKIIAQTFIDKILIEGENVNIIWKI